MLQRSVLPSVILLYASIFIAPQLLFAESAAATCDGQGLRECVSHAQEALEDTEIACYELFGGGPHGSAELLEACIAQANETYKGAALACIKQHC